MAQLSMDRFLEGCGAAGPLALEVTAEDGGRRGSWSLPQPFALVGRDPRADVVLTGPQISKRHVYFQILAGHVFWMDLGSRTGVNRGGIPAAMGWLGTGEAIHVGPYRIRIAGGPRAGAAPEPGLPPDPLRAPIGPRDPPPHDARWLELPRPGREPLRRRIRRVLTLIGRARTCRICFVDGSISRFHGALLCGAGGLWAVDLLSRTGLRVNGAPGRWAGLAVGDELQVGPYRFEVRDAEAAAARDDRGSGPRDRPDPGRGQPTPSLDLARLPEPSSPAVSLPAGPAEPPAQLVEAVLEPVLARLGRMQEQMFDQYHEAMMSMLQVVGTLHREQVNQVRQELDRIQDLTRELQALQDRAAIPGPPPPEPRAAGAPGPGPATASAASPPCPAAPPEPDPEAMPAGFLPDPDAAAYHSLIIQRMTAIRSERQNHWQKIIGMVTGTSNR